MQRCSASWTSLIAASELPPAGWVVAVGLVVVVVAGEEVDVGAGKVVVVEVRPHGGRVAFVSLPPCGADGPAERLCGLDVDDDDHGHRLRQRM